MESQKSTVKEQAILIQNHHTAMLKKQQMQSEILLKQIQAQMESEVQMKNEIVRQQISMFGDMQMQNPSASETVNIHAIMENLRQDKQSKNSTA